VPQTDLEKDNLGGHDQNMGWGPADREQPAMGPYPETAASRLNSHTISAIPILMLPIKWAL